MANFKKGHKGYWLGRKKPHSKETKNKISKAHIGKKHSKETKRKIGIASIGRKHMLGVKKSTETKKRISDTLKKRKIEPKKKFIAFGKDHPIYKKGKPKCLDCGKQLSSYGLIRCWECHCKWHKGVNTYNWKGITPENQKIRTSIEYKLWRKSVFERDNFICQKTGISGGELVAHHIQNFAEFPELRLAIDNGITLSKKSHKKFHDIYGRRNNTKEQLLEFLNN